AGRLPARSGPLLLPRARVRAGSHTADRAGRPGHRHGWVQHDLRSAVVREARLDRPPRAARARAVDPCRASARYGPRRRATSGPAGPRGAHRVAGARPRPTARQPQPHRSRRPHAHPGPAGGTAGRPRGPAAAGRPRGRGGGVDVTQSGAPHTPTVLLYAQDHQGLGHITRTLTIARRVLAAYPTFVAYIATKSPVAANFTLPERCDYIKLPTLLTAEGVERSPAEEEAAKQRFRTIRGQILRAAALGLAPDLVLVDHEPLGAKGEFHDGLYALKAQCPGTKFVFGLRDIMDDVGRIQGQWRELGVYDALEHLYDGIAVYGSPALYDVADAYDIPAAVQPKLHYCGYVVRDPPALDPGRLRQELGLPPQGPLIVATVGSGSDGYPVLEAAQGAVERLRAAARGLARWVHPKDLAGPRLVEALRWAVGCDRRAHAERVREVIPAFDGAARLVAYLARWLGGD